MTAAIELYKSCISLVEIITVLILASNYAVVLIHNMGLEVYVKVFANWSLNMQIEKIIH